MKENYWDVIITAGDGSTVSHYPLKFPKDVDPNRSFEETMKSIHWAVITHGNKFADARVAYTLQDQELAENNKNSCLTALKATGFVKAVVHYGDGSFWLWMKNESYNVNGELVPTLQNILWHVERRFIRGHDCDKKLFGSRKSKSTEIELVEE